MGNNQVCCGKNTIFDLDNNAETYIREQLMKRSKEIKDYDKIKEISQDIFGVSILDIEEDPLLWITPDLYDKFIKQIFSTRTSDEKLFAVTLNYNAVDLSISSYKEKFNLLILIWLLGISPDGKMNKKQKRELMKSIIVNNDGMVTFSTVYNFLKTFLECMLTELTFNFKNYDEREVSELITRIYNPINVNEYSKWLSNKLRKLIVKSKKSLTEEPSIRNEYINDEQLEIFIKENSFLFSPVELRNNFYSKYINADSSAPLTI